MDELDQTGNCLPYSFLVTSGEMGAKLKVPFGHIGVAILAQCPHYFSQIIRHKSEMIGVELIACLLKLPTRQVKVQAVEEGCVHLLGHWIEKVRGLDNCFNIAIQIAQEDN